MSKISLKGIFSFGLMILYLCAVLRSQKLSLLVLESLWVLSESSFSSETSLHQHKCNTITECITLCNNHRDCNSVKTKVLSISFELDCVLMLSAINKKESSGNDAWTRFSKVLKIGRKEVEKGVISTSLSRLAEADTKNIALGKPTYQSSLYEFYDSSRAVDGNKTVILAYGSCSHTEKDEPPWWKVDLLKSSLVYSVTLTNRGDYTGNRLSNVEISIGFKNDTTNDLCANHSLPLPVGDTNFPCVDKPMKGRYLVVLLRKKEFLTLCEVQVNGIELNELQ